jgi:hypothetical protein
MIQLYYLSLILEFSVKSGKHSTRTTLSLVQIRVRVLKKKTWATNLVPKLKNKTDPFF